MRYGSAGSVPQVPDKEGIMKRRKTWLLGLLAAVLLVGAAVPSWAYTLTLVNGAEIQVTAYVEWLPSTKVPGKTLWPGQTFQINNDDWHNKHACWTEVRIVWDGLQDGCNNSPFKISLMKCGDVSITVDYDSKHCKFFYTSN